MANPTRTDINWKELVLSKEEELKEKLEGIYKSAACFRNDSIREELILGYNGELTTATLTQGTIDPDVWTGNAIVVGSMNWFDISDGDPYQDDFAQRFLKENGLWNEFVAWAKEEQYDLEFDRVWPTFEEWEAKAEEFKQMQKDYIEILADEYIGNWVDDQWDELIRWVGNLEYTGDHLQVVLDKHCGARKLIDKTVRGEGTYVEVAEDPEGGYMVVYQYGLMSPYATENLESLEEVENKFGVEGWSASEGCECELCYPQQEE